MTGDVHVSIHRPPGWDAVAALFRPLRFDGGDPVLSWLTDRAALLLAGWQDGRPGVDTIVSNWHPELVGHRDRVWTRPPSIEDARLTVARELGFVDWPDAEARGWRPLDPVFESTVDAMLAGDLPALRAGLAADPELATARSGFGHRARLLHYLAANGVETERQVVPGNGPELIRALLDAGADPDATMEVYGGSFTAIELLETSAHPADAGLGPVMAEALAAP